MQKQPIPNYQGSLGDYKDSMKAAGPSKPKPKRKDSSSKEDPTVVRKMQDRLGVVRQQFQETLEDKKYNDQGGLSKMGSEIDKLQTSIAANSNSRGVVAKKPGTPKGKARKKP
jgi:hypothetical protein